MNPKKASLRVPAWILGIGGSTSAEGRVQDRRYSREEHDPAPTCHPRGKTFSRSSRDSPQPQQDNTHVMLGNPRGPHRKPPVTFDAQTTGEGRKSPWVPRHGEVAAINPAKSGCRAAAPSASSARLRREGTAGTSVAGKLVLASPTSPWR